VTRASSQPPSVLLDVLGRRIRVEAGGHPSAAQVEALWSRCRWTDAGPGKSGANRDETVITLPRTDRPLTPEAGLHLADELRDLALAAAADRLVVLRAAAVATPDGAVLGLFSADPALRAGAAAELSRRGFGYVTDELLATDESFDVVAFPEPLRFEQDGPTGPDYSTLAGPDALGMRPCPDVTMHLAAAVLLEHDPEHHGAPELSPVRRPDDVRRLEDALVSSPAAWSATALPDLIDEVDGLWALRYGEIHAAAPVLAELLRARTQQTVGPGQLYVAVGIGDSDDRPTAVSGHHLALDGLRRVVWMAAAGGASIEDLHAAANRELADRNPISVQLVAAAASDLMALRLLVPEEGIGRSSPAPSAADELADGAPANRS
jgi:hypothetical protein